MSFIIYFLIIYNILLYYSFNYSFQKLLFYWRNIYSVSIPYDIDDFPYIKKFKNINSKRSKSVINYCKNDNEEYQRIKTDATLLLFNNKDMIKDTYKEKYNKNINSR